MDIKSTLCVKCRLMLHMQRGQALSKQQADLHRSLLATPMV
ncbi:MAG: hypothetical protein ABW118_11280 [Candidatus Thiodiazotropha sp.]